MSALPAPPRVFVDTGVLLHAVDDHDGDRRDRARAWLSSCWTARCGRTSVQVLSEFYADARRHFPTAISAGDASGDMETGAASVIIVDSEPKR